MKILYLVTQSSWGGAQKYVFDLANSLKNEFEVQVACGGNGQLAEKLKRSDIKINTLKYLKRDISFFYDIKAYFELKKLLLEIKPDVLHVNSSKAGVLGSLAARKLSTKVVYTVHGAVFTAAFNKLYRMFFKKIEKWTAKYKQKIIAVCANDRRLWLDNKICHQDKIITVNNGIDLSAEQKFLSKKEAGQFFINKGFEFNNKIVIGTIANFYAEKNLMFFLQKFKKLTEQRQDIALLIIGDGPQRKEIEKFIKENNLNKLVFLAGFVNEAWKYLRAFNFFALLSKKEGFPYVLLEAQLAKVPVIASNVGGISEIVINEQTGLLFEVNNSQEFLEKIKRLLNDRDLSNLMVENGYTRVKEKFNLAKSIEKTKKIYSSLTSGVES